MVNNNCFSRRIKVSKDIVIITPAEKAKAKVINLLLSDFEKNTINAPITVDSPAKRERRRGIKLCLSSINKLL